MPLGFTAIPNTTKPGKLTKKPSHASIVRTRERGPETRPKHKGPPPLYKEAFRHPGLLISAQPNVTRALRYAYDSPESDLSEGEGEGQIPARSDTNTSMEDMGVLVYEEQNAAIPVSGSSTVTQGMHPIKRDPATVLQRSASFSQPTRHAYPHLHQATVHEKTNTLPSPARPSATPVHAQQRSVTSPSALPCSHSQTALASPAPIRRAARNYSPSRTPTLRSPARTPPPGPPPPVPNLPYNSSTSTLRASSSTLRASSSSTIRASFKHRDHPYDSKDGEKKLYITGVCLNDFPAPPTHLPEPSSATHVRGYPSAMYGQSPAVQRSQTNIAPLPVGARPSAFVRKEEPWLYRVPRHDGTGAARI